MHPQALLTKADPMLRTARVQQQLGENFLVCGEVGMVCAKRAASCLIKPEQNDLVLVFLSQEGSHILSVLEKADEHAELLFPDETTLTAKNVTIAAQDNVLLQASTLTQKAHAVSIQGSFITLTGTQLKQCFHSLQLKASSLLTQASKSFGFFHKVLERIEDVKDTEAARMRVQVQDSVRVRARTTDVQAKESVLIDGQHIKIG